MLSFIDNVEKILIEMLAVKNAGKNVKKLDFVVCVREEFFFPRERFQTFGTNIHPWLINLRIFSSFLVPNLTA